MITEQQPQDRRSITDADDRPASEPRSRWPWPLQVLLAVVGLVVSLAVAVAAVKGLAAALGVSDSSPEPSPGVAVMLTVVPSAVVMIAAVVVAGLLARFDGGRRLGDAIGRVSGRRHLTGLLIGVGVSLVLVLGIGLAVTATGAARMSPGEEFQGPVVLAAVIGLAQAFALQGIPEELLFRGYLLRSLRMRPWVAVVVSAVAFGAIHLASNGGQQGWGERVAYLAPATGFALTAGALVFATGSVASAVGIHGGFHLAMLVSGLLAPAFPALAIGEGPAVWLSLGAAYTLVAVAIMVRKSVRLHRSPESVPTAS